MDQDVSDAIKTLHAAISDIQKNNRETFSKLFDKVDVVNQNVSNAAGHLSTIALQCDTNEKNIEKLEEALSKEVDETRDKAIEKALKPVNKEVSGHSGIFKWVTRVIVGTVILGVLALLGLK